MKTMIKTSLVALALLVSAGASAQMPISFGVKAGANLSNYSEGDMDAKFGFNVGITADINIAPSLYVLTGLELTTKGAKQEESISESFMGTSYSIKVKETSNPMYLQLPIHLGYKLEVTPGTNIVFRAGPYLAYGIGGKSKTEISGNFGDLDLNNLLNQLDLKNGESDIFGNGENQLDTKRFDFGIGGGVGAEFGKISATIGYDLGLTKLYDADGAAKNRNAYLSLGYRF